MAIKIFLSSLGTRELCFLSYLVFHSTFEDVYLTFNVGKCDYLF